MEHSVVLLCVVGYCIAGSTDCQECRQTTICGERKSHQVKDQAQNVWK